MEIGERVVGIRGLLFLRLAGSWGDALEIHERGIGCGDSFAPLLRGIGAGALEIRQGVVGIEGLPLQLAEPDAVEVRELGVCIEDLPLPV
ncbi:MAG: hypothetical protein P8Z31_00780, partial [Gammaproteobacteria bacterium]